MKSETRVSQDVIFLPHKTYTECVCFLVCSGHLTLSQVSLQLQDLRDRHRQDDGVKRLTGSCLPLDHPRCTTVIQAGHVMLKEQIGS